MAQFCPPEPSNGFGSKPTCTMIFAQGLEETSHLSKQAKITNPSAKFCAKFLQLRTATAGYDLPQISHSSRHLYADLTHPNTNSTEKFSRDLHTTHSMSDGRTDAETEFDLLNGLTDGQHP
eukprot:5344214-Amphidinium_carterae.1